MVMKPTASISTMKLLVAIYTLRNGPGRSKSTEMPPSYNARRPRMMTTSVCTSISMPKNTVGN